jgi:hypothetical protein
MTDHDRPDGPVHRMPEREAITLVRRYILRGDFDTTGYPVSQLQAERFSVGWMVYVPVRPGAISIDRAVFYVGDDGTLEHATSAVAPSAYIADFEERFFRRHG